MRGRTFAQILLAIILIGAAIGLGVTAYNAGVSAGLAQNGTVTVAPAGPYVGYAWGWGFGHGFGFFGFLGGLLFLFLLFGLIRAAFGGGHHRGWGGPGGWGDGSGRTWEERARETHDAWHREHPDTSDPNRPA